MTKVQKFLLIPTLLLITILISSFSVGGVVFASEENSFSIEYHLNGGQNTAQNPLSYETGKEVALLDPSREGYQFLGWFTNENLSEDSKISVISAESAKNIDLYAKWAKIYKITYVLDGAENNTNNPSSFYNSQGTITLSNPLKKGYSFMGWYSTKDFQDDTKITEIDADSLSSDLTLYAKFSLSSIGTPVEDNPPSLIWLWILLGVVWAALIVLLLVWMFGVKKTLVFKKGNYEIAKVTLKWNEEIKYPKNLKDYNWYYGKNKKPFNRKTMGFLNRTVYYLKNNEKDNKN